MRFEPVTLQSVAKRAGVSVSTVHRVMKNKNDVSRRTADMVRRIALELGYEEPGGAEEFTANNTGSLISDLPFHTYNIGLLLIERPLDLLRQPLNARLLTNLESALSKYHLMMTVVQVPDPSSLPRIVSSDRLDGVILLGEPSSLNMRTSLREMRSVGVFASEHIDEVWSDWVTSDYQARGRLAANYLVDRGHKRIAFLNVQPHHCGFEEVGMAFSSAGKQRGAEVDIIVKEDARIDPAGQSVFYSQKDIDEVIRNLAGVPAGKRPTGMHVPNDEMAIDVYNSLRNYGIEPMEDIDIISCDNDELFLSRLSPRPATMDLSIEVIAERLVEKLLYRIKNPDAFVGVRVMVPPTLVVSGK